MYRYDEIKKLLDQHDYLPIVCQRGDGCILRMPHPTLIRPGVPRLIEVYALDRGKTPGIHYNSTFHPEEHFVEIPEYAMRLVIMSRVTMCCRALPISRELLNIVDEAGDEVDELEDIIKPPSKTADAKKEDYLISMFHEARTSGFPDSFDDIAVSHGVHEGYIMCKNFCSE